MGIHQIINDPRISKISGHAAELLSKLRNGKADGPTLENTLELMLINLRQLDHENRGLLVPEKARE